MPVSPLRTLLVTLLSAAPALAGDGWVKHDINPKSVYEAAGAFDVDKDGDLDIVSGTHWYEGPDYKKSHKIRDVERVGTYNNCFSVLPVDVNADGWLDFVSVSYFGKNVGWVENPGKTGAPWTYHEVDLPGPSEAAWALDLTGDGVVDYLPNTVNVVVFYTLANAGSSPEWKKVDLGTAGAGHGVGTGDINGDGRIDILTPKGWYEAPEDRLSGKWLWHADWEAQGKNLGATGIQILGRDFDGDGLTDVVWGAGHGLGFTWMKQTKGEDGKISWSDHLPIDPKFHQAHTLFWADLDGDGQENELVTGTRVYGHEVEPGDTEAPEIAYFTYDSGKWSKHPIYLGEPAANAPPVERRQERDAQKDFAPGTAGTGLQMTAIDLDGDGDKDLLCPGKTGLYWFENTLPRAKAAAGE
jgi:hypothetical protein